MPPTVKNPWVNFRQRQGKDSVDLDKRVLDKIKNDLYGDKK